MFEFIIGDIVNIKEEYIVLQNNNIGYKVLTSTNTINNLSIGSKDVLIYTDLISRDDGIFLYGFSSEEELSMFRLLLLVSRVGPKVALGILSTFTSSEIGFAIINGDVKTLSTAPGIGKKTAERIILELRDRVDKNVKLDSPKGRVKSGNEVDTAISGLLGLGYTKYEIDKVFKTLDVSNMKADEIIKEILKGISS